jgi:Skp family chaperone for outer membrane proteins
MAAPAARAESNIAVLDVAKAFEDYEMTRDLESIFDQARQEAADEAKKRTADIEQRRKALAGFDPASDDFTRRESEVSRKESEFQVWSTDTERRLKNHHKRWLLKIYHNTRTVVADLAKERKIDIVLTYDQLTEDAPDSVTLRQQILLQKVIYSSERIDLTAEVVARLNKAYQAAGGIQSIDTKGLHADGATSAAPPPASTTAPAATVKPSKP